MKKVPNSQTYIHQARRYFKRLLPEKIIHTRGSTPTNAAIAEAVSAAFPQYPLMKKGRAQLRDYLVSVLFDLRQNKPHWPEAPPRPSPKVRKPVAVKGVDVTTDEFLQTWAWRELRYKVIRQHGARCMCCGASRETGAVINVDHIKPRKKHPELALDINNLQILCGDCNAGKGNWDETDWRLPDRTQEEKLDIDQLRELRDRGLLN